MSGARVIPVKSINRFRIYRLEPLTTLIVGLIMVFANLLVLQEAAMDSITGNVKYTYRFLCGDFDIINSAFSFIQESI